MKITLRDSNLQLENIFRDKTTKIIESIRNSVKMKQVATIK